MPDTDRSPDGKAVPPPADRMRRQGTTAEVTKHKPARGLPGDVSGPAHYRELLARRPHPLQNLDGEAVIIAHHRGQEICCQGRRVVYWYLVISGAARRCAIRCDGRRQIVDLLLAGDFCGFTSRDEWDVSVEALVEETVVAAYPRQRIEMMADSDAKTARDIRQLASMMLSRLQAQMLILGRITAIEKVSSFLLEISARHGGASQIALPISRYDIADYLSLSVETVSRSLSELRRCGAIKLLGTRTITILDPGALGDADANCIGSGPTDSRLEPTTPSGSDARRLPQRSCRKP